MIRPDNRCDPAVRTAAVPCLNRVGLPAPILEAAVPDNADARFFHQRFRQQRERRELTAANDDELAGVCRVSGLLTSVLMHGYPDSKLCANMTYSVKHTTVKSY